MTLLNKPIEVAAYLDSAGIIKPLRFKDLNEDGSTTLFQIKRSIRRDKEKLGEDNYIYTFTCEVIVEGKIVLCDLKYNVQTKEWILFRM
ncbi:MAG: hypothetical protein H7Y18_04400 [Clostridiaceae bacterium]|nr:hypothetical protein [Clostridiaceae bacterium]